MRHVTLAIPVAAALALAGCATQPRPVAALATTSAQPAQPDAAGPAPDVARGGVQPGTQADLTGAAGDRVYFAVDQFVVAPDAREALARQATWLTSYPNVRVIIAGNADERGTREYNVALGGRRAEAARQALIAQGVASDRIQTVSYGKERPVDPGSNEAAWATNRNAQTMVIEAVGRGG